MKVNRKDRLVRVGIVCALIGAYPGDAQAHGVSVPWLQAKALDAQGIYLALDGPTRIRKWAPLTFSITVLNARGKGDYVLTRLELIDPQGNLLQVEEPGALLVSQRERWEDLRGRVRKPSSGALTEPEQMSDAIEIAAQAFKWRVRLDELDMKSLFASAKTADARVRATLRISERDHIIEEALTLHKWPALPTGREPTSPWRLNPQLQEFEPIEQRIRSNADPVDVAFWFAGDQHVHSKFSIDTWFVFLPDHYPHSVTAFGNAGRACGLSWVIITDHSNVDVLGFYTEEQFDQGFEEATQFSQTYSDFTLLYSQEMGVHTADPENIKPAHLLVYPRESPSTGYIPNPCDAGVWDVWSGWGDCESADDILQEVEARGGAGFIAHPFSSGPTFDPWDLWQDVAGYAGLEIWSSKHGIIKPTDTAAWDEWRLGAIAKPCT